MKSADNTSTRYSSVDDFGLCLVNLSICTRFPRGETYQGPAHLILESRRRIKAILVGVSLRPGRLVPHIVANTRDRQSPLDCDG